MIIVITAQFNVCIKKKYTKPIKYSNFLASNHRYKITDHFHNNNQKIKIYTNIYRRSYDQLNTKPYALLKKITDTIKLYGKRSDLLVY